MRQEGLLRDTSRLAVGEIVHALGYLISGEGDPPRISDWETLEGSARRKGLLPLLDLRADSLNPPKAQARAAWIERQRTRVRTQKMLDLCSRVLERLDSAGLRAAALKGSAHALGLHQDAGLRNLSDVDILVPQAEFARTCESLIRMGLAPAPMEVNRGYSMSVHHERGFNAPEGGVDLHRSYYHPRPYRVDYSAVWSRAKKVSPGWALSPEDHFLHACIHQAKESFLAGPVGFFDMCALIKGGLDWDLIGAEAAGWRCRIAVAVSLRILQDFARVALPSGAARLCAPSRKLDRALRRISSSVPPFLASRYNKLTARRKTALALSDSTLDGLLFGAMYASRRLLDLFFPSPRPSQPRERDAQDIERNEAEG